jgi:hypothetical protein
METSASYEARYAPLPYPTNQVILSDSLTQFARRDPTDLSFSLGQTATAPAQKLFRLKIL